MTTSEAAKMISERFADSVLGSKEFRGETGVDLKPEAIQAVAEFAKSELGFDYLLDITSVDHFGEEPRYEVVYELSVLETGTHLRLKVKVSEDDPVVDSVMDIWPTANWHEREIYDMMGIRFAGHNDLRRILMWEGYPYHPLRKDFPLEGKPSDVAEVAFTNPAPLAGGPFVTAPTDGITLVREPRARRAGDLPPKEKFIAEP
jgi:NADH-quinone oxidoreductase subunit C